MTLSGKLFVISAPSGAGKTTLIHRILRRFKTLSYSVSHTTRAPRKNEKNGVDYYFISSEAFEKKIKEDHWLEWAKVHDNYYGTSKHYVLKCLEQGKSLLLDIDVQGACQVMASEFDPVSIFIMPPSFEELEKRLTQRGTDKPDVIKKRLENAAAEIAVKDRYRYIIVNDDLDEAVESLCAVFEKELD